ncbi:CadD family cadmium resistance transporter [Acrocarpospora macrocephala]|uniref:Cadmium transporter n=1 Tax=Acrocarpospora macrocephala TaxID=150177 RepID=A0A5M3WXC8_9ACTN|nr:cadmium resistance transporter [Acrocarpospora macrocephala]GES14127.1 cadmium transporter [Acrocarpospora macrocephala]
MSDIPAAAATAAGMFIGTNVDDLLVLTVLFLSARAQGSPKPWQVWTGQYLGIAALLLVSGLAALGLSIIPDDWIRVLGLVPIALGIRGLITAVRDRESHDPPPVATGMLSVAAVTIANGADNVSVYTPVFRTIGADAFAVTLAVFAAGVAVWCLAGSWLGSHRKIIEFVERYGRWLVPGVFVLIGLIILI